MSYLIEGQWETDKDNSMLGHMTIILFPVLCKYRTLLNTAKRTKLNNQTIKLFWFLWFFWFFVFLTLFLLFWTFLYFLFLWTSFIPVTKTTKGVVMRTNIWNVSASVMFVTCSQHPDHPPASPSQKTCLAWGQYSAEFCSGQRPRALPTRTLVVC